MNLIRAILGLPTHYVPMGASRLFTAFDYFFANDGNAQLSYVRPRWYESLAAGTVVIGRGPDMAGRRHLLDWPDALIKLSSDPATATEETIALLADDARLAWVSRERLVQMNRCHDWAHRLADMLTVKGLPAPQTLTTRLDRLARRRADEIAQDA